ncbi:FHY3/FAR1 family protein [Dioscorea alata]|uniref:FHY3/FAR1 family protein n=1 Tax=Dioscorea alata TaxID=55571 RepID=A0ACB7UD05_DIOAL|nr:FHY3/FAR1 family protein [Dioscorea alata]
MEFETEEAAYMYYNMYAGYIGFSIQKSWANKSKVDGTTLLSRKFCCFKEGFKKQVECEGKKNRKDLRVGCNAQMIIGRQENGKYYVTFFEEQHNHQVVTPRSRHKLPSQRKITIAHAAEAEIAKNSGIRQKENLGFTLKDISNHLQSKRMREMREGEAYTLIHYLEKKKLDNSSFFYLLQYDAESQIANIFWADPKMVIDYALFGDVVCFDTTYRINNVNRPCAPIIGVNHHKEIVVFGVALFYDETTASFEWLFTAFLEVMKGKKPITIFTNQDAAMAKAIAKVFPETYHRICSWHLFQNALKHLGHIFKGSNKFSAEFKSCMHDFEYEEDFIHSWNSLLEKHKLQDNKWCLDTFQERRKWAMVYSRHTFSAGIRSTQLCESFNSRMKCYVKPRFNVLEFFTRFEKLLDDVRYQELESNYEMSQLKPALKMNQEYEKSLGILQREHKVTFDSKSKRIGCCCMSFEFVGYLCSHALKVLDIWNIKIVPSQYMLNRWTKHAREGCVVDYKGRIVKEDPRLVVSNRSKDLSHNTVIVASRAAESEDASIFFARKMVELSLEVEKFFTKADKNVDDGYFNSMAMNSSQSVDNNDAFTSEQNEISKELLTKIMV